MSDKHRIARAAGLISVATFTSRILGYIRDMVFAFFFGATGLSDTLFVAFRIPNLLRELFAEGAMSAAFIPVLTEYHGKYGQPEARRLVRAAFTFILVVVGVITVLGIIFAPYIVALMAPGFVKIPDKFDLTVTLTRIMFPFLLFISLAALSMGALNTKKIFFIPALAPAMLNITIISTLFILVSQGLSPIMAVAVGVAIGGLVQFGFQTPSLIKNGYSLRPELDFSHPGLKKIFTLILPVTLGLAVSQINIVVSNILASFLAVGSITYLFYSMHLIQFPIGVFGVAMGTAILPSLSEHAVKGDTENLRNDFSFALRLLFFISVPAMAGLIALREPIISTLFQRGQFDYAATLGTSQALLFYALGIWAVVGVRVIAATFYAMQDTKTPVKAAVIALVTNIVLSVGLMGPMSFKGLALANATASIVNFFLLFYLFRKRLGRIDARRIIKTFFKISLASLIMGLVGWYLLRGDIWAQQGMALKKAAYLSGGIILCAGIYLLMAYILKSEELGFVLNYVKAKMGRNTQPEQKNDK